jgi:hypothetical protein
VSGVLIALIVAVFGFVGPYLLKRQDYKRQDEVAKKVAEVATTVETANSVTNDRLEEIHVLVNSRLTDALNEIARLRDYLDANARPGDPTPPEPH